MTDTSTTLMWLDSTVTTPTETYLEYAVEHDLIEWNIDRELSKTDGKWTEEILKTIGEK